MTRTHMFGGLLGLIIWGLALTLLGSATHTTGPPLNPDVALSEVSAVPEDEVASTETDAAFSQLLDNGVAIRVTWITLTDQAIALRMFRRNDNGIFFGTNGDRQVLMNDEPQVALSIHRTNSRQVAVLMIDQPAEPLRESETGRNRLNC